MKVHVLIYEHRHGADASVHTTGEQARRAVAAIAREFWETAREMAGPEGKATLPEKAPKDDAEAVSLYFGAHEGFECFAIRETEIDGGATLVQFLDCIVEAEKIRYVPFVTQEGRVGYAIHGPDQGSEEFFYLVPSQEDDAGDARTVFVYHGQSNDPAIDGPLHFYPVAEQDRQAETASARNLATFLHAIAEGVSEQYEALEARISETSETLALRDYFSQLIAVAENVGAGGLVNWAALEDRIGIDLEPEAETVPEPAYTVFGIYLEPTGPFDGEGDRFQNYATTVYTHNGPLAAASIAQRVCREDNGAETGDDLLQIVAVIAGEHDCLDG